MQTSKLYLFYEFKTISYDIEVSGKDIESGIKSEGEKSQKIPRNISGCVFISHGRDEAKMEEHFHYNHNGEENISRLIHLTQLGDG